MRYFVASDSFKDSLSSYEVGLAIKTGIVKADPQAVVEISPMADGGEGTIEALSYISNITEHFVEVHDPLMQKKTAKYIALDQNVVFIESAQSSGLMLVPIEKRNPMHTNTFGLGEQIKDAILKGYKNIIISLGGSATNDGGVGMLQALGWEFFDADGKKMEPGGNPLVKVNSFSDKNALKELHNCQITIASDVTNPFYGENGAAYVFAKQKGANEQEIAILDNGLRTLTRLFEAYYHINVQEILGSGAAGGLGGAIIAALQGKMTSGAETIIELLNIKYKIGNADIVITGEGSIDQQTLSGKVPIAIAKLAKQQGKFVIGIAGRIDIELNELNQYIDTIFSIQTQCRSLTEALQSEISIRQLEVTAEQITRLLLAARFNPDEHLRKM